MNVRDFNNDVAIITREVTQAHLRFIGGELAKPNGTSRPPATQSICCSCRCVSR
jgi:hypothetical protein